MSNDVPPGWEFAPRAPARFWLRCPDCEYTKKPLERPMKPGQTCPNCDRLLGTTPIKPVPDADIDHVGDEDIPVIADGGTDQLGDFDATFESTSSEPDTPDPIDWERELERTLHVQNDDESHTERNAVRFHPSQLANCKRQALKSKFGLEAHDTTTLGTFKIGTLVHEWLEAELDGRYPGVHLETPVEQEYTHPDYPGVVEVVGTADVWDEFDSVVYDWKTRGGWYKFDPPSERHLNQLTLYMDALDADAGQVVYLNKKNLEVRTWPENCTFAFDPDRRDQLVQKAFEMRERIKAAGDITTVDDIPAQPCGCWLCQQEENNE